MKIRRSNLRILVKDFRESFRFYRNVVGLPLDFGTEDDMVAEFDAGTVLLTIVDLSMVKETMDSSFVEGGPEAGDRIILVFQVEDLNEAMEELAARGATLTKPLKVDEWHIVVSHFRDPDGNLMEIQSVPK
ncbi:MAG: VOC family protein [Ignavibacteria bacterium]|nr:VOC family protein [Ignavibacteria bacterium]